MKSSVRSLTGLGDSTLDNATRNTLRQRSREVLREQLTIGLPTRADEKALRQLRAQMDSGDVAIRLHLAHRLHAKLYICHRADDRYPRLGYVGSSNLTFAGLGGQGELNVDVPDTDASKKLAEWFEERWLDQCSVDVTSDLLEILDESWARPELLEPYLVYLKMAYHLSQEARDGLIAYGLPADLRVRSFGAPGHRGAIRSWCIGQARRCDDRRCGRAREDSRGYRGGEAPPKCSWRPCSGRVPQEPQAHVGGLLRLLRPSIRSCRAVDVGQEIVGAQGPLQHGCHRRVAQPSESPAQGLPGDQKVHRGQRLQGDAADCHALQLGLYGCGQPAGPICGRRGLAGGRPGSGNRRKRDAAAYAQAQLRIQTPLRRSDAATSPKTGK